MVRRLRANGLPLKVIARDIGCKPDTVGITARVNQLRPGKPAEWVPGPGRLSVVEREEIMLGLARGESMSAIARRLERSPSTITREVAANGGLGPYGAWKAHCRAREAARRPKIAKLSHPPLAQQVTAWLEEWWSPQEICARLRIECEDDPMMQVSHETIYQSLFVQGRGELRRELARCLRSGRAKRRPQGRLETRGKIPGMVMISDRPAEIEDRAVPGHWEGDLIVGKDGRSAVGTLVERSTRYVLLLHLGKDHTAPTVDRAMRRAIATVPGELFRTITWDQGAEMARHANFTVETGIQIYFCDPHSPWQRGSNENTNGLLRQYMPKGTDLSVHSEEDLAKFARSLNNRPRATLGFMKPSEKLSELVAHTG
ncbi:MAG TPA: IS30 family transposase [Acidimicrobiales bacterium]|nr:IS30 family transposase [Acidimicrobiales bacterium]